MSIKKLNFTFAYSFSFRVVSAVRKIYEDEPHLIDFIDPHTDSFCKKISAPQKNTLLHDFIRDLNYMDWEWIAGHTGEEGLSELSFLLMEANIPIPDWLNEREFWDHKMEIYPLLEKAAELITESAFHLLFSDRDFLFNFQSFVATAISPMEKADFSSVMAKKGVVKRPKYLPVWLRNAIFHRDKGRCQLCFRDLTGLLTPNYSGEIHLDHMLPLEHSGSNDPTNFQLTCKECNLSKGAKIKYEKPVTFSFW